MILIYRTGDLVKHTIHHQSDGYTVTTTRHGTVVGYTKDYLVLVRLANFGSTVKEAIPQDELEYDNVTPKVS